MLGLLLINKPKDITSFGAVAKIKRLTGEKRVGHTGTLDPMATGVLPILIGRATTLSSYLLEADKSYTARVQLGVVTDTLDITGKTIAERKVECTNEQVTSVLNSFIGKQLQKPPIYSAIKKDGVRLYELARKGENVQVAPREIEIFSLKQTSPLNSENEFEFETRVSKGTYIRSLVRDIGEVLGCGATLSCLVRTETAGFCLDMCVDLESLNSENIGEYILSASQAVSHLENVNVTEKQAVRFTNGGQLDLTRLKISNAVDNRLYSVSCNEKFLGVGRINLAKNQLDIACIVDYL